MLSLIFKKFWLKLKMKIKPTSARSRNRWASSKVWPPRDRPCWGDFSRSSSFQGGAVGPQKQGPELVSSSLLMHPPTSREGPPSFWIRQWCNRPLEPEGKDARGEVILPQPAKGLPLGLGLDAGKSGPSFITAPCICFVNIFNNGCLLKVSFWLTETVSWLSKTYTGQGKL